MLKELLDLENKQRVGKLHKDLQSENFLFELNNILEEKETLEYKEGVLNFPFIYVIGLPRSGTTLLMHILSYCLDIGYINNIISRFWSAPVMGIKLSQILLGTLPRSFTFKSFYGKTRKLYEPHEFSYFWLKWLQGDQFFPYNSKEAEKVIDWQGLKSTLLNMSMTFNKGMLFKGIWPSYHMEKMESLFSNTLFIYIKRRTEDVAISLKTAREAYYNDPNVWWSVYPEEYNELKDLSFGEQIAGQIFHLQNMYEKQLNGAISKKVLTLTYENLCRNPEKELNNIVVKAKELYHYDFKVINQPPEKFEYSTHNIDLDENSELKKGLNKFNII